MPYKKSSNMLVPLHLLLDVGTESRLCAWKQRKTCTTGILLGTNRHSESSCFVSQAKMVTCCLMPEQPYCSKHSKGQNSCLSPSKRQVWQSQRQTCSEQRAHLLLAGRAKGRLIWGQMADLLLDGRLKEKADLFLELALAQVLHNQGILIQLCCLCRLLPCHLQYKNNNMNKTSRATPCLL